MGNKIRKGGRSRRIIDDKVLLEMMEDVRSGKIEQKDIAAHFGISQSAITQRLRKITSQQLPDSFKSLSPKEQNFAIQVAHGKTQTAAAMASFDTTSLASAKTIGARLMKDNEVVKAVNDVKESIADKFEKKGYGQDYRIGRIGQHMESPDAVISLKAIDMAAKLSGDEEEARRQLPSENNYTTIDKYSLLRMKDHHYKKRPSKQGWERCHLCNGTVVTGDEEFCEECKNHCPDIIEKVERYWNGDKCAICRDDRRCWDFCKACKKKELGGNHV